PAHGEGKGPSASSKARRQIMAQREVQEHFVRDERHLLFCTKLVERRQFSRFNEAPRWIIGMDHNNSARLRNDRLPQAVQIDLPAMIVDQRIRLDLYILDVRQKIKQRIAG